MQSESITEPGSNINLLSEQDILNSPCDIIASVRITPLGIYPSIRQPVETAIKILKFSGIPCKTCATCTEMCGAPWDKLMDTIHSAIQHLLVEEDIHRLFCDIHLDCKKFSR